MASTDSVAGTNG